MTLSKHETSRGSPPDDNRIDLQEVDFSNRIKNALEQPGLSTSIQGAMQFLRDKRIESIDDPKHWAEAKAFSSAIRDYSVRHLEELLEELEANCIRNKIQVHWAENAGEARDIIATIALNQQAKKMVKGKSMASEEIELNAHLNAQGIDAIETDMGEYIVQLAGETPSHIIMPAIHKTQAQIAQLFRDKLSEESDPDDVDALIAIGRKVLRKQFETADIGLSGVNFGIAETGTLCLVENEGNGRLSTTVPNTHIALMGIEKVIPSLEDLPSLLYVLTRSATGQKITTYINLINGPRRPLEKDGPEHVHLVLLDNGRSTIRQSNERRETLKCIRCGACMNHCPVYSRIGGHAYGTTYPGPIGQAFMPQIAGGDANTELLSACSLNAACAEACPVSVPLPDLIRSLRASPSAKQQTGQSESMVWRAWSKIHQHSTLYRLATRTYSLLPWLSHLTIPKSWKTQREYPKPSKQTLHQRLRTATKDQTHDQ